MFYLYIYFKWQLLLLLIFFLNAVIIEHRVIERLMGEMVHPGDNLIFAIHLVLRG